MPNMSLLLFVDVWYAAADIDPLKIYFLLLLTLHHQYSMNLHWVFPLLYQVGLDDTVEGWELMLRTHVFQFRHECHHRDRPQFVVIWPVVFHDWQYFSLSMVVHGMLYLDAFINWILRLDIGSHLIGCIRSHSTTLAFSVITFRYANQVIPDALQ